MHPIRSKSDQLDTYLISASVGLLGMGDLDLSYATSSSAEIIGTKPRRELLVPCAVIFRPDTILVSAITRACHSEGIDSTEGRRLNPSS